MGKVKLEKVMLINTVKYKGEYLPPGKVIEMEKDIVEKLMQDGAVEYFVEKPKSEANPVNATSEETKAEKNDREYKAKY